MKLAPLLAKKKKAGLLYLELPYYSSAAEPRDKAACNFISRRKDAVVSTTLYVVSFILTPQITPT